MLKEVQNFHFFHLKNFILLIFKNLKFQNRPIYLKLGIQVFVIILNIFHFHERPRRMNIIPRKCQLCLQSWSKWQKKQPIWSFSGFINLHKQRFLETEQFGSTLQAKLALSKKYIHPTRSFMEMKYVQNDHKDLYTKFQVNRTIFKF